MKKKLTQKLIDAAEPADRRYSISDTEIPGFRLHVLPSGKKGFYFAYRVGGGRGATQREPKIGQWPAMKAEAARRVAASLYAEVCAGGDPAGRRRSVRDAPRMSLLFERYIEEHAKVHKKDASIGNDERLIANRLRPVLGGRKVEEVQRSDIDSLHRSLVDTPYEANRALALLSKAFNLAEIWGMRPEGSNPCRHVQKFPEAKRRRFLSAEELARLGDALRFAEREGFVLLRPIAGADAQRRKAIVSRQAVAAIRLLIFTGARKSEVLDMQWSWIDVEAGRLSLPDSKTGQKTVVLPPPALKVLSSLPRVKDNPHVITGAKPGSALVNLNKPWRFICEAAELHDVRLHDLRHSFAAVGASGGASLAIIGGLLGHSQPSTTKRYAHLSDNPLQDAAARISESIEAAMSGGKTNHGSDEMRKGAKIGKG